MLEWSYVGVNASIPRNVGPECAHYLPSRYKILETLSVSVLIVYLLSRGYRTITLPKNVKYLNQDRTGRRILLVAMTLILGIEIGFKLSSKTVIYLLNPCHITTFLQLYLLAANPSSTVTVLFRLQLNFLNGAFLAYAFPETESRQTFADLAMYYLQHGLLVVIPFYLLRIGGVYNAEPLMDFSWCCLAYGINLAYHFWVLQLAALPVQVNLSHMLCPAVTDPFQGQYYRLWAVLHEGLLCPLMCKLLCFSSIFFIEQFPALGVAENPNAQELKTQAAKRCKNGCAHSD